MNQHTSGNESARAPSILYRRPLRFRAGWIRFGGPLFVAVLMLGSSAALAFLAPTNPVASIGASAHSTITHLAPSTPTAAGARIGGGSGNNSSPTYIENGTGAFFTTVGVPNGTSSFPACHTIRYIFGGGYRQCFNATVDPTVNQTSNGITGAAFTTFTNDSPCASMRTNATSEVGFTTSTNFGNTWAVPRYFGNPVCSASGTQDQNYSNAFEPSLTSLANGTFVMAYVEYNITNNSNYIYDEILPYALSCEYETHSRVVVTESYDNGSTWTTPYVLNETDVNTGVSYSCAVPGEPDLRPSVAAYGDTAYVSWMDSVYPFGACCAGILNQADIFLAVSTNGGASWTNASVPPSIVSFTTFPGSNVSAYPNLMVAPNGTLYMSYATNYSETFVCGSSYCGDVYGASVIVAWSSNNGTAWGWTVANAAAGTMEYYYYRTPALTDPMSQLAFDQATGQVDLVYATGVPGTYCYNEGVYGSFCDEQLQLDEVLFQSSSNGGLNWTGPQQVAPGLANGTSGTGLLNSESYPSMAIDASGTVEVSFQYTNDSICFLTYSCGGAQYIYVNSSDGGVTWSQPTLVTQNSTYVDPFCPSCEQWMGASTATIAYGTAVLLVYPMSVCNTIYYYCSWGASGGVALEASRLYQGTGLTVTFRESGLPTGQVWSVTVGGYLRDGPSGVALSLSGVPPAYSLTYTPSWVNTSYGIAFEPSATPASPGSFSSSSVVAVSYTEYFLLNVNTVPAIQSYFFLYSYTNYAMSPLPGAYWVPANTTVPLSANLTALAPFCYPCLNLTFLAWTGYGAGAVNTNSTTALMTVHGPINETASFGSVGYCYAGRCTTYNFTQTFVEDGLPASTLWSVSIINPDGSVLSSSSTATSLIANVGTGLTDFQAWTIPTATAGQFWVPTSSTPSPFAEPAGTIFIHYQLKTLSGLGFQDWIQETGLPNGTSWSYDLGGGTYGASTPSTSITTSAGSSQTVGGETVYFQNGTAFYAASLSVEMFEVNSTIHTYFGAPSLELNGSALVTVNYQPMYLLSPSASVGGTVSGVSQWVHSGSSVTLNATPSAGYHFVSWTGTGGGSVSSGTSTSITVRPSGPVSEFATFRVNFPATWNVTLTSSGLPAGMPFTLVVGGVTYTAVGTIKVGNYSTGIYNVSAPTIFANTSNSTEFVPTGIASTAGLSAGVLDLTQNLTLTVSYQTEYLLSLWSTDGGQISGWSSGAYWENASSSVSLTATADTGYLFQGWSGTVSSTSTSIVVPINGVANETASFLLRPISAPSTYWLSVTESGLPSNTPWSVSVGTIGASGSSSTVTVSGLNGTYQLTASTVFTTTGVRYVSNTVNVSQSVTANATLSVTYTVQYLVTVSASEGGTVTPSTAWANGSQSVTISATPNATSKFIAWNGTGTGAYSGSLMSTTVTVTGPINEQATFAPLSSGNGGGGGTTNSGSASNGQTMTIAIVVALLIAGLVVGLLVGRARGGGKSPEPAPAAEESTYDAPPSSANYGEESAMPAPEPAPYDEGPPQ